MLILSIPAIYSLELTPACNNHCAGCSNVYAADRTSSPMPASAWETWLADFAPEAVRIRLTGGEPTLHPEFFRILEVVASYRAWITVFTNGRWTDPMRFVKRLQDVTHLSGLLVSLHGASPHSHGAFTGDAGSFHETVTNIRLAVENGIPVALSTIITHHNWNELKAIVELGEQLGVQHVAFNRYLGHSLPGVETDLDEMRAAIACIEALIQADAPVRYGIGLPQCFASNASEGCPACAAYVAVDPWGNVRPCAHSPTVVGSLCQVSMAELWHSDRMNAWRALTPSVCTACAAYPTCHGGCRAIQELRADGCDPLRREPLVQYTPPQTTRELPADVYPVATTLRLRPEPFGYAVLGEGHFVPVSAEARAVIEACDGTVTFAQLATRFGQSGLNLLGELWELGMLTDA